MGKRKKSTRKPQGPKKSVTVKLEKKIGVGQLSCKVCGQSFQTGINYLSAAVDVYSDWIDACDTVAKDAAGDDPRDSSYGYHEPESRLAVEDYADREPLAATEGSIDDDGD
ncbi:hypothetical protein L228DRAFT_238597 [Xylona heveae TC161]|uniref:Transcription elongation factor 1 homolog n=1 Tax=Xylona heveae (strain CBS 132557 / TC161) TaxID=1328760 RepID=A0A165GWA1_XYLHT|nr:hypothetical protein L228DRAFT_238597 [Xylona heveae TC161]KZF22677.1 hypothetical protein L228DRAFT_238597 [Xylona heveae TC161]